MSLSEKVIYEHGSKACLQYSQLTFDTRRFGQQVLVGYFVGIAIALTKQDAWSPSYIPFVLALGGIVLTAFAAGLWLLNYHYSTSFRSIRDLTLIPLESGSATGIGPWTAHKVDRDAHRIITFLAWHAPFVAMIDAGVGSAFLAWHYAVSSWGMFWLFGAVLLVECVYLLARSGQQKASAG